MYRTKGCSLHLFYGSMVLQSFIYQERNCLLWFQSFPISSPPIHPPTSIFPIHVLQYTLPATPPSSANLWNSPSCHHSQSNSSFGRLGYTPPLFNSLLTPYSVCKSRLLPTGCTISALYGIFCSRMYFPFKS